jgi:hypothetical protein
MTGPLVASIEIVTVGRVSVLIWPVYAPGVPVTVIEPVAGFPSSVIVKS